MSTDQDFIEKLNQHYGTPKKLALDALKKTTDGDFIKQIGMTVCAKTYPEIPLYAAAGGAVAGVAVTLVITFVWSTLVRRRRA